MKPCSTCALSAVCLIEGDSPLKVFKIAEGAMDALITWMAETQENLRAWHRDPMHVVFSPMPAKVQAVRRRCEKAMPAVSF